MSSLFENQSSLNLKKYEKILLEIEKYGYDGRAHSSTHLLKYDDAINEHSNLPYETERLRKYVNGDSSKLDEVLPKAFAIISEALKRHGKRPYPVQLMGAMALHDGNIAEMKTGEGKTITAIIAAYLNALTGKGVHITTSNSYLAKVGYEKMGPILQDAGLSVGVVAEPRNNSDVSKLEERRKAYQADITYGASDVFAFDYLYDNIAKEPSKTVLRREKVGFVVIDEADQILVNNATTPFKLSGNVGVRVASTNDEISKAQSDMKNFRLRQAELYQKADNFVYQLYMDKKHCLMNDTNEQFEIQSRDNKEIAQLNQALYSVIFSKSNGVELTERGFLSLFQSFKGEKINNTVNSGQIKRMILSSSNFVQGENKDYTIDKNGNIVLTLRGIERSVRLIPDVSKLNDEFYKEIHETGFMHYLNNALNAYFVQSVKENYTLQEVVDRDGKIKHKVALIMDGRTAEGRVYAYGLQQAIELKEKRLNPSLHVELTEEYDELASISQRAFFATYGKVGGMTGTSAKEIFENIYGMDTVVIPKDSEYSLSEEEQIALDRTRIDKPEVVFATEEEKLNAVIASVEESRKKGQPVLIGTYSDSESLRLYREFQKRGIPCEFLNTENSVREAEIISRAGLKGSVTISTQMAGRGTDIMLGGDTEGLILEYMIRHANEMVDLKFGKRPMPVEVRNQYVKSALEYIKEHRSEFLANEGLTEDNLQEVVKARKEELVKAGGLKVIGYGHYDTKRNDDQLRGRASRQRDPGVTEFYSSIKEDLEQKLKIPTYITDEIRKLGLEYGKPLTGTKVEKIIAKGQSLLESNFETMLSNMQEQDQLLSKLRTTIYHQRQRILFDKEVIKDQMEYIIESSAGNLIDKNLPNDSYNVSPKKKIKSIDLNMRSLMRDVMETFGLDLIEPFREGKFKTLGDIDKYIVENAKSNYYELRKRNGDQLQDEMDKDKILATIDKAWLSFQDNLEDINIQKNLNAMAQNNDFKELSMLRETFNQAMRTAKLDTLQSMFGKKVSKTKSKEEASVELDNSYFVFDNQENKSIKNLLVRAGKAMTSLFDKVKLVRNKEELYYEMDGQDVFGVYTNKDDTQNSTSSIKK